MKIRFSCSVILVALIHFLFISSTANAQENMETGVACDTHGFVVDNDPAGLNLRESPKGKIITQIPINAELKIVRYDSGWFEVTDVDNLKDLSGWVYAKHISTGLKNYDPHAVEWLTEKPDESSKKVIKLNDIPLIAGLLECQGGWVKIQAKEAAGWLAPRLQCPLAYTNCS